MTLKHASKLTDKPSLSAQQHVRCAGNLTLAGERFAIWGLALISTSARSRADRQQASVCTGLGAFLQTRIGRTEVLKMRAILQVTAR